MNVNLPDGWVILELKDVAKWGSGGTPKSGNPSYYGGEIPWAVIGDLNDGVVSLTATAITQAGVDNSSAKIVPEGTLLLAMYGSIGKLGITGCSMATNQAIAFARPDEKKVRLKYLFFYLLSQRQEFLKSGKGATQQNISQTLLKPWPISIAPLDEQAEIVRILEEQFSRLDAAAASIAAVRRKADQFRRSLLNAAFSEEVTVCPPGSSERQVSWEFRRLGDCLEKLKSGKIAERGWSPQCLSYPSDDEGSWGVLKTTAVQMGEFQPEHNKELPKTLTPKTGLEVEDGDFLLITTSPRNRCGVVCQVKTTRKKLIFSGKILRFRVDEERVLADWLMFYLMSPKSQEELDVLKVGTSDSSVSIGNKQVLDLMIPVAPIDVQRLVTSLLDDEMTRLAVLLQTARTAEVRIAALRRSLLNSAFSGELTKEWREKNNG